MKSKIMKSNYSKYILFLLILPFFTNCNNDDNNGEIILPGTGEIVTLNIKHYRIPAFGLDLQLALSVQEGDDPNFRTFLNGIEDFTYELGFDYELLVRKSEIDNPPADGSSIRYELIEVVSQTVGSTTETFEFGIVFNFGDVSESFITGTEAEGFDLLNTIPIDCSSICDELLVELENGATLTGTFTRNTDNTYTLVSTNII